VRRAETGGDVRAVTGGQEVAGSNPASPTRKAWSEGLFVILELCAYGDYLRIGTRRRDELLERAAWSARRGSLGRCDPHTFYKRGGGRERDSFFRRDLRRGPARFSTSLSADPGAIEPDVGAAERKRRTPMSMRSQPAASIHPLRTSLGQCTPR
jgi:hypothetical protein